MSSRLKYKKPERWRLVPEWPKGDRRFNPESDEYPDTGDEVLVAILQHGGWAWRYCVAIYSAFGWTDDHAARLRPQYWKPICDPP